MSRKIAFRAWDGKMMHYKVNILSKWGAIKEGYAGTSWTDDAKAGIPMQYTGLKDKNGKEIFEGDIIPIVIEDLGRSIKTANGVVKFKRGQWNIEYFHPFQKEMYICNLYRLLKRREKEVLGNIYENPKLLDNN